MFILILPNLFFVIGLALSTGYLTFLTTKGSLTNNKYKNIWRKITFRGKLVIATLIIILALLIWQEWNLQLKSDNKEAEIKKESLKRDAELKIERDKKDSAITIGIKKGVDSNSHKLFNDISIAFSKQGLILDTLKKEIKRVQDSANNVAQVDPVLQIDPQGIYLLNETETSRTNALVVRSRDAGSTNFIITTYLVTEFMDGSYDVSKDNFFPSKLKIAKNSTWVTSFSSRYRKEEKNIYVYLIGTYTTLDGKKTYEIGDLYKYYVTEGKVQILLDKARKPILDIINSVSENRYK